VEIREHTAMKAPTIALPYPYLADVYAAAMSVAMLSAK
jgi:hypothetical protein